MNVTKNWYQKFVHSAWWTSGEIVSGWHLSMVYETCAFGQIWLRKNGKDTTKKKTFDQKHTLEPVLCDLGSFNESSYISSFSWARSYKTTLITLAVKDHRRWEIRSFISRFKEVLLYYDYRTDIIYYIAKTDIEFSCGQVHRMESGHLINPLNYTVRSTTSPTFHKSLHRILNAIKITVTIKIR